MKMNSALARLRRVVGTWAVTGSHPYLPGRTLRGRVTFQDLEGGAFLHMHSKIDDPQIPEGVAIFGTDDAENTCTMLYFDERGVARRYDVQVDSDGFSWTRHAPDFSQRFRVAIAADARTMESEGTMRKGQGAWEPDLRLSYVRVGTE